ncbi:hypothetical protein HKBW3S44_00678 [Candidatus Hakubella thermalkaliphila]|uniref:Uncharacterized protein n=1 Tax=Candidatus Hakubella thermalkaliphila TaxID=2754717 RepID=A0A6V8QC72_9ACTN|nr:hypothetical protein [Candidatus Hakubella thermalkaliphila]GFP36997.1 hypothetical protein HKBW3S44_00678 [Candidatus Hakubella thermalkaliphila]GFP42315.1 hypothetical protein HKBW3C_01441 [Candidatus Hakubella thermalkaliphila]
MEIKEMELKDYCCLNRPRFRVDPESDAEWFFGNKQVGEELLSRISSDFDIAGVPKCALIGRFGDGKTHTLYHIKYLFEKEPENYPAICFFMGLAPYDERIPDLAGWRYFHGKMLDAMGEEFLRQIVQEFDRLPDNRTADLSEQMKKTFRFGDENLKRSLANVLSGYFLRETKSMIPAWQWLRGSKLEKGAAAQDLAATKALENAEDMINVVLNLGNLVRKVLGKGITFLMDEGQALGDVSKRDIEIHHAFLQLASDYNQDVGFVFAYFGRLGAGGLPKVLSEPPDILSRLRVTPQNMDEAFINLLRLINTKDDMRSFIGNLLEGVRDMGKAEQLINEAGLAGKVTSKSLPFTEDALGRAVEILYQNEQTRNARMIINELARVAAAAYHQGKATNQYVIADRALLDSIMQRL